MSIAAAGFILLRQVLDNVEARGCGITRGECTLSACDKNSLFILACCERVCFALYALAVIIAAFGFVAFAFGFACRILSNTIKYICLSGGASIHG